MTTLTINTNFILEGFKSFRKSLTTSPLFTKSPPAQTIRNLNTSNHSNNDRDHDDYFFHEEELQKRRELQVKKIPERKKEEFERRVKRRKVSIGSAKYKPVVIVEVKRSNLQIISSLNLETRQDFDEKPKMVMRERRTAAPLLHL